MKIEKTKKPMLPQSDAIVTKIFGSPGESFKADSEAENVSMIIAEWLKKQHIRYKTRYTKRQVIPVTILQSLADTFKIKTLSRFLLEFRINKLSEEGKSSSELENILSARLPNIEQNSLKKIEKYLE
jgi:hypothetical protein